MRHDITVSITARGNCRQKNIIDPCMSFQVLFISPATKSLNAYQLHGTIGILVGQSIHLKPLFAGGYASREPHTY
jgi:hypothetical protein